MKKLIIFIDFPETVEYVYREVICKSILIIAISMRYQHDKSKRREFIRAVEKTLLCAIIVIGGWDRK